MITIHESAIRAPGYFPLPRCRTDKDWDVIAVKGAPDVVLNLCTAYQAMDDQLVQTAGRSRPAAASWPPTMP